MALCFGKRLDRSLLCAAAALALTAPAHAAVYVGSWDPAFGPDFPDLGWRATADLYVPTACESAVGTQQVNNELFDNPPFSSRFGNVADCSSISLNNVQLTFYNVAAPGVAVETFNLGSYGTTSNDLSYGEIEDQSITSVDFVAGVVTGFQTSASFRVNPNGLTSVALLGSSSAQFSLTLSLNPGDTRLRYMTNAAQTVGQAQALGQVNEFDPEVSFRAVPEPLTIGLVLAALAAAGAATGLGRRRQTG